MNRRIMWLPLVAIVRHAKLTRISILVLFILTPYCIGSSFGQKVTYEFVNEPIDVVIPTAEKDLEILELCINGIRNNGKNIRNIYVVSSRELSKEAYWFDEKNYPFTKKNIASIIFKDEAKALAFLKMRKNRIGWIYQQLLKLYAPLIIPGISSNVLVLDADTIFLAPTTFLNEAVEPFFNPAKEHHRPYFEHGRRLIPEFNRVLGVSGISHHMLIQKSVIEHLFKTIELSNGMEPWKAFCNQINAQALWAKPRHASLASEYEIYFNFIFSTTTQAHIRKLHWKNVKFLNLSEQKERYHYISYHSYKRKTKIPSTINLS